MFPDEADFQYETQTPSHLDNSINQLLAQVEQPDYKISIQELSNRLEEVSGRIETYISSAPDRILEKGYGIELREGEYYLWKT